MNNMARLTNEQLREVREKIDEKIIKNVFDIYNYQEVYEDLKQEELIVLGMI